MKKHIEDHTDRPNITFVIENTLLDRLGTLILIERHFSEYLRASRLPSIAKATDLQHSIFDHE